MQSKSKGKAVVHCRRVAVLASKDVPGRNIVSPKSLLPYTPWLRRPANRLSPDVVVTVRHNHQGTYGVVHTHGSERTGFQASHSTSPWSRPWLFTLRRSLSDWTLSANSHDSVASPFRSPLQTLITRSDDVCLTVRARAFRKKVGHLASIHTGPIHVCPRCLGRSQQHNDRAPETPCSSASRAVDSALDRQEQQSRPRMSPVPSATIQVVALMVGAGEDPE